MRSVLRRKLGRTMPLKNYPTPSPCLRWCSQNNGLTGLSGLPPCLLDVFLSLVAQLDLQLLGLHLQVFLPLCEGFAGLEQGTAQPRKAVHKAAAGLQGPATHLPDLISRACVGDSMPMLMMAPWCAGAGGRAGT